MGEGPGVRSGFGEAFGEKKGEAARICRWANSAARRAYLPRGQIACAQPKEREISVCYRDEDRVDSARFLSFGKGKERYVQHFGDEYDESRDAGCACGKWDD